MSHKRRSVQRYDYNQCMEMIKLLMIPFVCFWAFGFPVGSEYVMPLSGFVVPTFMVFSGYCILSTEKEIRQEKLKRACMRALIFFGLLFVAYVAVNLLNPLSRSRINLEDLKKAKFWFNFLVLNMWPLAIGDSIWFIQSLLYAYVILLIADKCGLLKFYKIIMVALMISMVLSGELSGVIHFNMLVERFDYQFIPGGAITRALPYLLLGMFMREKKKTFQKISPWIFILAFIIGGGMVIGELRLLAKLEKLVYVGHMLGYGVMATALCGLAIAWEEMSANWFTVRASRYAMRTYALHNPVYYILITIVAYKSPQNVNFMIAYGGVITLFVCLLICGAITFGKATFMMIFTEPSDDF